MWADHAASTINMFLWKMWPCLCALAWTPEQFMETFHVQSSITYALPSLFHIGSPMSLVDLSIFIHLLFDNGTISDTLLKYTNVHEVKNCKWGREQIKKQWCIVWALGWSRRMPCVACLYEAWCFLQPLGRKCFWLLASGRGFPRKPKQVRALRGSRVEAQLAETGGGGADEDGRMGSRRRKVCHINHSLDMLNCASTKKLWFNKYLMKACLGAVQSKVWVVLMDLYLGMSKQINRGNMFKQERHIHIWQGRLFLQACVCVAMEIFHPRNYICMNFWYMSVVIACISLCSTLFCVFYMLGWFTNQTPDSHHAVHHLR